MFGIHHPRSYELVNRNCRRPISDFQELKNNRIVVISVIGQSEYNSGKSVNKRAFKLILDGFGDLTLKNNLDLDRPFTPPPPEPEAPVSEPEPEPEVPESEEKGPKSDSDFLARKRSLRESDHDEEDDEVSTSEDPEGSDGEVQGVQEKEKPPDEGKSKVDSERLIGDKRSYGEINGFYNEEESIVFLQLNGAFDAKLLLEEFKESRFDENKGFLSSWADIKSKFCQTLLLLFSISHIILLSDAKSYFDTNYIHLFRTLDAARQHVYPKVVEMLSPLKDLPINWIEHGRLCSPRVLFFFEIDSEFTNTSGEGSIKERRECLREEIYQILRKCRIITNISSNSLFALPRSPEYVFLYDKSVQSFGTDECNPEILFELISKNSIEASGASSASSSRSISRPRHFNRQSVSYRSLVKDFKHFLLAHVKIALSKGFVDNTKRISENKIFFVTPTLEQWSNAFNQLSSQFIHGPNFDPRNETLHVIKKYVDIDSEYLEVLCDKMYPVIFNVYTKNLPEFYSYNEHNARLNYCINLYYNISRGPEIAYWQKELRRKCENYWKRGRQQCSELSLNDHECTNPIHRVKPGDHLEIIPFPEMDKTLPVMQHNTRVRITSYCNCGKRQASREEPFTIREANYEFYKRESFNCCERFESYSFPIFIPPTSSEGSERGGISIDEMIQIIGKRVKTTNSSVPINGLSPMDGLLFEATSQPIENELRQENRLELDEEEDEVEEEEEEESQDKSESSGGGSLLDKSQPEHKSQLEDKLSELTISKNSSNSTQNSKVKDKLAEIVNSTKEMSIESSPNEYLVGMIHSKSPSGLLPLFPSWSLICLGSSSLYAHNSGISHQPGFIVGTNYLLPWDVMVKAEEGVTKPVPRLIRGRKPSTRVKRISDEFTVKIFIGIEYECKRGHRFLLQSPDKISYANSNLSIKELGNEMKKCATKVANSDMPLYFKCPCNRELREGRSSIAQIMRIHVVTPKAPVFVRINPRVQPSSPPCPIFYPGNTDPIKLTQSSYWVLRLPYCYVGDCVYKPPKDNQTSEFNGKLLKGLFDVIPMNPEETKTWESANIINTYD